MYARLRCGGNIWTSWYVWYIWYAWYRRYVTFAFNELSVTVSDASLDESGSNLSKIAATSLLLGVTRTSSEAYLTALSFVK